MSQQKPAVRMFVDKDMDAPRLFQLECGSAAVFSARCPGKESPNEDAAAVIAFDTHSAVLIVADGMGGGLSGEKASSMAVRAVANELVDLDAADRHQLRAAILNGIESANKAIMNMGVGAATTLAVVEVQEAIIRPYHVGDSRIVVVGGGGRVKLQTIAHSPVGYGVEAGLLDEAEAMNHEDRHVVSNMVGSANMRIEIGAPLEMARRDTLLLASDGLTDNLHLSEIVELIRKGRLLNCASEVAAATLRRMTGQTRRAPSKPDDLTFLAYRNRAGSCGRVQT